MTEPPPTHVGQCDDSTIATVARRIVVNSLKNGGEWWEQYPEVGEHDWSRVVVEVDRLAATLEVPDEEFKPAYALLSERAERDHA